MLNKIMLMGRLVRDPELRHTGSGTAVASFTLAVDRDYKTQSGEKETDFIDIVAWFGCCDMCVSFGQPEKCQKCARYYLSPDPPESDRNAATVEDATPERYQWLMGRFAKEE